MNHQGPFAASVDTVLTVFAVLVGIALTDSLARQFDPEKAISTDPVVASCLFAALTLLALRYFLGSANHLNATYVHHAPPRPATLFFFKDVTFLLIFGGLTVFIAHARCVHDFMFRTMSLLLVAALWGVFDVAFRIAFTGVSPGVGFWLAWALINLVQFACTFLIDSYFDFAQRAWSLVLVAVYLVALGLDHWRTLKSCQGEPGTNKVRWFFRWLWILYLVAIPLVLIVLLNFPSFNRRCVILIGIAAPWVVLLLCLGIKWLWFRLSRPLRKHGPLRTDQHSSGGQGGAKASESPEQEQQQQQQTSPPAGQSAEESEEPESGNAASDGPDSKK